MTPSQLDIQISLYGRRCLPAKPTVELGLSLIWDFLHFVNLYSSSFALAALPSCTSSPHSHSHSWAPSDPGKASLSLCKTNQTLSLPSRPDRPSPSSRTSATSWTSTTTGANALSRLVETSPPSARRCTFTLTFWLQLNFRLTHMTQYFRPPTRPRNQRPHPRQHRQRKPNTPRSDPNSLHKYHS